MVPSDKAGVIEFKWGKKRRIGGKKKNVQFYESFTWDGVDYSLYDAVYLYDENEVEPPHVGLLIKIWELPDGSRKVKILWFFRPCEISNFIGNAKIAENELLLASGEGVGLTNVNPLESISGKCNVVYTSKDGRTQVPSNNGLQEADFVFYRTFDVGRHTILEDIDGKIAGEDVKNLLSRMHNQESSTIQKLHLNEKGCLEKAIAIDETNKLDVYGNDVATHKTNVSAQSPHLGEKMPKIQHDNDKQLGVIARPSDTNGCKTTTNSTKDNVATRQPLVVDKPLLQQKPTSSLDVDRTKHCGHASLVDNMTSLRSKDNLLGASCEKVGKVLVDQATIEVKGKVSRDANLNERPQKQERVDGSMKVHGKRNVQGGCHDFIGLRNGAKLDITKFGGDHKKNQDDERNKRNQETTRAFDGKAIKEDMRSERSRKATCDLSRVDTKVIARATKHERDSQGFDSGPFKKPKIDEKHVNVVEHKMSRPSPKQASNMGLEFGNNSQILDKSKWFKLPWDERICMEHEKGRLVLLQNLDPSFSSTEVEEIIQKAFKLSCSAKMIQQTAFSSRNYGQAFGIFPTRQAAEMVVKKLDEGCLMLPNGRPLVGIFATPRFPVKRSTFCGHLVIDKPKHQMQREMKEAISTSHCSQPNTIEFEMAIEWCRLQERSGREWKSLQKLQGNEFRNLKAMLKSK